MLDYHPTHDLLVRWSIRGTTDHDGTLLAAFESAGDYADEAWFRIERDTVSMDRPDVVDRLDEGFDGTPDGGATLYRSADVENALDVLASLLAMSGPGATGVRELGLAVDDQWCLQYVPEHSQFTLSDDIAPGIAEVVSEAVRDEPAILLPDGPLAEWEHERREYGVGTSLCVERRTFGFSTTNCYTLSRLGDVTADAEERTIRLRWETREHGPVGNALDGTIGLFASAVGAARPMVLHFDSADDFTEARDALTRIVDGLHGDDGAE